MRPTSLQTLTAALLLASSTLPTSCTAGGLRGSGIQAIEARQVPAFTKVHFAGSAKLLLRAGEAHGVKITGDDNLVPHFETTVTGDTLSIAFKPGSYSARVPLQIEVRAPELTAITTEGAADVEASGLRGTELQLSHDGSSTVRAQGEVAHLRATLRGSGDLRLYDLQTDHAELVLDGAASAQVHARTRIDVSLRGSGNVRYRGGGKVNKLEISGSGTVVEG